MVKVTYQNNGSRWVIFLTGTEQGITEKFNSFWNLRATSGELIWDTPTSAHFWSPPQPKKKGGNSLLTYFRNFHALHSIALNESNRLYRQAEKEFKKNTDLNKLRSVLLEDTRKRFKRYEESEIVEMVEDTIQERIDNLHGDKVAPLIEPLAQRSLNKFRENNRSEYTIKFALDTYHAAEIDSDSYSGELASENQSDEVIQA